MMVCGRDCGEVGYARRGSTGGRREGRGRDGGTRDVEGWQGKGVERWGRVRERREAKNMKS